MEQNKIYFLNELNKVNPFFNYKGLIIEKIAGGYKWGNIKVKELKEIDKKIEDILNTLKNSIV